MDTLRADELGAYGSERGHTPRLDALARESVVFESAWAPAPLTLPSIGTLHTGRYPDELGLRTNESALPAGVPTLATELAARGWRTGAVVANFVLRRASGLARGFERFDDAFPQQEAVRRWPERVARSTTDALLAMLQACAARPAEPCFLWAHYQDPHGPYDPPAPGRERFLDAERREPDGDRELPLGEDQSGEGAIPAYQLMDGRRDVAFYRAGYRGEVAAVDEQIGRVLDALESLGLAGRAVVVFAADHGESLGEDDVWFAHGARLRDEQVRVPLFVRAPGLASGRRREPVSLVDLYPTLLGLAGGTGDGAPRPGRDLLAPGAARSASRPYLSTLGAVPAQRRAVVEDGYKLVRTEGEPPEIRLRRLGDDDVDLTSEAPERAARLGERLESLRDALERGVPEQAQPLEPADRERLRALGYLEP